MGFLSRRKQRALEDRIGNAVQQVTAGVGSSPVDDYFACVLMSAVSAAGRALSEFVEVARDEGLGGQGVAELIKRLDGGGDVVPPLRVASWGYVNQIIEENWSDLDQALEVAVPGLGFQSRLEERIAKLNPSEGTVGDAGYQTRLARKMLGALVESLTGAAEDAESDLPSILLWSSAFGENWTLYRLTLDRLAPDGPPS